MRERKTYTDEEKLDYWMKKLAELEMQIQIAKVRISHLAFKLGRKPSFKNEPVE